MADDSKAEFVWAYTPHEALPPGYINLTAAPAGLVVTTRNRSRRYEATGAIVTGAVAGICLPLDKAREMHAALGEWLAKQGDGS